MKIFLILLLVSITLSANVKIAVSYPFIGALVKQIGGDSVETVVLAKGNWDPHFVIPKPSLIAKVRNADGLIINGGQLEIGWLPPLIRRASNPKTNVGAQTFLNLSRYIKMINVPSSVDRAGGDVHPDGNPHFHLDPNNILILANVIKLYLSQMQPENSQLYEKNYVDFSVSWKKKMKVWSENMASKKGLKIIQFHDNLAYFNKAYGLKSIANIEPLPGIPPSSRYIVSLIRLIKKEKPSYILHDVYHSTKSAQYISSKTGVPIILMPHDIGALENIEDMSALFDYLTGAMK